MLGLHKDNNKSSNQEYESSSKMHVEIKGLHVYCLSGVNYYPQKKIDSRDAPQRLLYHPVHLCSNNVSNSLSDN